MTAVIGIDPSIAKTGLAIIKHPRHADHPNRPHVACIETDGTGDGLYARADRIGKQLGKIWSALTDVQTALVMIETIPLRNPTPSVPSLYQERCALYFDLVRVIKRNGIPVAEVNVKTLKKWATGDGNAEKRDVIDAMQTLWPHAAIGTNDNKSDALALATIGAQRLGWYEPELPHHLSPRVNWPVGVGA